MCEKGEVMARRHKVNEIHLEIIDLIPFSNDRSAGFIVQWDSDIGFGEYTVYKFKDSDVWRADAETMDNNEDKDFIKELMRLFIEKLQIQ